MKIRIKFRKRGVMKFVGHLDMMRYFQKAMRRAGIDICYSAGFSPHQIMSFAAPLGVGLTSDGEYFDIEAHSSPSSSEAIRALNETMADGVEVTGYVRLSDDAKSAMSQVAAADYELRLPEGFLPSYSAEEWEEKIKKHFRDAESFTVVKKTKKGERALDLKPLVYEFCAGECSGICFFLKVSTGSTENVKPELVLDALFERLGICATPAVSVHRREIYARTEDGRFLPLLDMGEEIA